MKRRIALAAGLLCFLASGCGRPDGDPLVIFRSDETVCTVGDLACTTEEFRVFLCNYRNLYGRAYGMDLLRHDFDGQSLSDYIKEVSLGEAARMLGMVGLAGEQGLTLTEEEEETAKQAAEAYFQSLNEAELSYLDLNQNDMEDLYQRYALAGKIYGALTASVDYEISRDEARIVRLLLLVVTDPAEADEVSARLSAGEDFAAVAAQYAGGRTIEQEVARGDLPAAVEEAAYSLTRDETTGPIETSDGWYFLKCLDKNVKELTEAHKAVIAAQREQEAFEDVYDAYIGQIPSQVYRDVLDTVELPEGEEIQTDSFFAVYEEYFS